MADDKKTSKSRERTMSELQDATRDELAKLYKSATDKELLNDDLIPAAFYNKKTGRLKPLKTIMTALRSRGYGGSAGALAALDDKEKEYIDRVKKSVKKIRRKKVTGPELTTPKSKKRKGAKGMFVGTSYRHGHKDLRKSGTSTRIK